jgi:pimeloyl-ACP methyl ester carboxylesterase
LSRADKLVLVADDWVKRMIDTPGRSGYLKKDGNVTHYLEWGDSANPRVMLMLHGFLGHAHWWDFVAPWFAHEYRVIAIDLVGMGDSSSRPQYTYRSFVAEVGAMLQMINSTSVTLVGHSFGGRITVFAAKEFPQYIARALIIDTNLGFSDRPIQPRFAPGQNRPYPDLETMVERFRFVPDEPPVLPAIMRHLATHSAKQQGTGYVWKFDEKLRDGVDWEKMSAGEMISTLAMPVDFIAGELSKVVPPDLAARTGKALRIGRGPIIIPSAHHHVPANQPLALVAAMRALLFNSA